MRSRRRRGRFAITGCLSVEVGRWEAEVQITSFRPSTRPTFDDPGDGPEMELADEVTIFCSEKRKDFDNGTFVISQRAEKFIVPFDAFIMMYMAEQVEQGMKHRGKEYTLQLAEHEIEERALEYMEESYEEDDGGGYDD